MSADFASSQEIRLWAAKKDSRLANSRGALPRFVILAWNKAHPERPYKANAHGSYSTYSSGCRCDECSAAMSVSRHNYRAAGGPDRWTR